MKKLISFILALSVLMLLCSCTRSVMGNERDEKPEDTTASANQNPNSSQNQEPVNNEQNTDITPSTPAFTTKKEGTLTMVTNAYFPPFEYYEGNEIVGIDVEIAQAIADELGLELEIMDVGWDAMFTHIVNNNADIGLAGITSTPDREKDVDFSPSYCQNTLVTVVRDGSTVTSTSSLYNNSCKIGVIYGTVADVYANYDFEAERLYYCSTYRELIAALTGGDVECIIMTKALAEEYAAQHNGLKILSDPYADEAFAAFYSKNNTALGDAIDNAINELKRDGTIDAILKKYGY